MSNQSQSLLVSENLECTRDDRLLFSGLNFQLHASEVLQIEGPNGSGKTSLLRAMAGLLDFETGDVCWKGSLVRQTYQAFRNDVAWLSHRVGFKGDLTITENLAFERGLRATDDAGYASVLDQLSLARLVDLPFRSLSAGQQRRVALARMLLSTASLWMMDEPVSNLDRDGRELAKVLLVEHLQKGGMAIVAAHQDMDIDVPTHRITLQ